MRKMRTYSVNIDGIHDVMVATTSLKQASVLTGATIYAMRTWEAGTNEEDEALALAEPEQVFRRTGINGTWERWDPNAKPGSTTATRQAAPAATAAHSAASLFEQLEKLVPGERMREVLTGLRAAVDQNKPGAWDAVVWAIRGAWAADGFPTAQAVLLIEQAKRLSESRVARP